MLIFFAVIILIIVAFAIGGPLGAPWVPAFKRDVDEVLKDAGLTAGQLYVELGCGDGRLVVASAKLGAEAIGYEINPVLWLIASCRSLRYKNAHIRLGDFWKTDLSKADVVMTFLIPRSMARLETKLTNELKSGATFVSYVFELPTKKPTVKRHHWFVYDF